MGIASRIRTDPKYRSRAVANPDKFSRRVYLPPESHQGHALA